MNIGLMITPKHAVPPLDKDIAAPWTMVADLANGLADNKDNSTFLFAPQGSQTNATLCDFSIFPTVIQKASLSEEMYEKKMREDEAALFRHMISFGKEHNIQLYHIHQSVHMDTLLQEAPSSFQFVITLHDLLVGIQKEAVEKLVKFSNCQFVSISNSQRNGLKVPFVGTVMHGIDTNTFLFSSSGGKALGVFGRVIPKKGQDDAIAVANQLDMPLYIVGKRYLHPIENERFWNVLIAPSIDNKRFYYVPTVKRTKIYEYYQQLKAMLFPIKWEEPFGLVMIEAMACGTPVIAYNRGSVPEIVKDGVTGFIIDPDDEDRPGKGSWVIKKQGIEGLVEAVKRIGEIDRLACRKHVEEHFTIEKMVDGYEAVYKKILAQR